MRNLLLFASLSYSVAFFVPFVKKLNVHHQSLNAAESPLQDFSNKITTQITSKTTAIETTIVETPKRVQESVGRLVKLPEELYNNATNNVNNLVSDVKATTDTFANLPTTIQIIIQETRQNISKGIDDFVYAVNTPRRVFTSTWKSVSSLSRKAVDTVYDIADKPVSVASKPVPTPMMVPAKTKTEKLFSFNAFKDSVYSFIDTTTATVSFLITAPGKVWRSVSLTATNTVEFVTSIPTTVTNTAQSITDTAKTTQTNLQTFATVAWSVITFQALRKFIIEKSAAIDTVLGKSDDKELTPDKAFKVLDVLISDKKVGRDGEQKFIPSTVATTNMRVAKSQSLPMKTKKASAPSIPNPFKFLQDVSAEVKGFQQRLDENRKAQGLVNTKKNIVQKNVQQQSNTIVDKEVKEKEVAAVPSAFVEEVMEMMQARPTVDDVVKTEDVKEEGKAEHKHESD